MSKHDTSLLTPDELALLNAGDPGDTDTLQELAADAAAQGEAPAAEAAPDESGGTDDALEAGAQPEGEAQGDAEDEGDDPRVFVPRLQADDPEAASARIKELRKSGSDLRKRYSAGELDDDQFESELEKIESEQMELATQVAEARATARIAQQTARQAFEFQRDLYLESVEERAGIPYTSNPIVGDAFGKALAAAGQKAIAEGRDPSAKELFAEADRTVREQLSALGVTFGKKPGAAPAPAGAAQAGKPAAQAKPRDVPQTLASMPAAAPMDTGGTAEVAALAMLEGDDLEIAVAKLPAAKRRELMERAA